MLKTVVGHSNDPDSQAAIAEVLEQCQHVLDGLVPKAGVLFAAIEFDHPLILRQIQQAFPEIELVGGTTDGEISSVLEFQQDSLTLMLFCSDTIEIRAGMGRDVSVNVAAATHQAVTQATAKLLTIPQLCLTIPESLTTSSVSILEGLKQALGAEVPIFGGLTADQGRFEQTYQFHQTEVLSDAVPVLLFAGSLQFSHGVASGWTPIGRKGNVTRVDKNVVYEIDGKSALDFYLRSLGGLLPSSEYPLAVFEEDEQSHCMRAPSGVYDPASGSVTFFGDVPLNAIVQITETDPERILTASRISMQNALDAYPGQEPAAALFFSCTSRRQILGTRTQDEYQRVKGCLSQPLPSCGFYTNGEIAPLRRGGETRFHNETFLTLLLGDNSDIAGEP